MNVNLKFEKSNRYTSADIIEVYANDAPIGILDSVADAEQLSWSPDDRVDNVAFQFRNADTFLAVVAELRRYKDAHGYKYLTIWSYNNGYIAQLEKGILEKAGFKHLPNTNPACMFLE